MTQESAEELFSPAVVARPRGVILLVDDEIPIQFLVWKLLRDEGFTVLTASSGESALRICRSYPGEVDLLLTDMHMSRMSGLELYRIVAAERPGIKGVIMSGDLKTKDLSATAGVPFLKKPFDLLEMRRTIERALADRSIPGQVRACSPPA